MEQNDLAILGIIISVLGILLGTGIYYRRKSKNHQPL